ncbi:hypothetical protein GE09DRAFT_655590 [Coniochaeta sp. 2T2.1]|nr:hypothetical protein GE09DRAFT_655590 [Coniochaeta sp. 2T2.1]
MKDYEIINDWHLTGPFAYEKVMEELAKAFRSLPRSHLDDIEADVGRTFGVIATLFRTAAIPENPSAWASQIAASLNEEGLEFQRLTRRWFLFYLQGKGGRNEPAPLPRALEVILKLCPTDLPLCTQTRAVYQAGLAMAVLSKNDVHFRYYAVRALRLEQSIEQNTSQPSYKDKRLFAVAHMNFAIAEATAGEWHSALAYLRQAEQLHIARRGPLPAARLRPELMSTRQDLFEVHYHMALITCRFAEHIRPGDACYNAYLHYEAAAECLELAKKQLKPRPSNNEAR